MELRIAQGGAPPEGLPVMRSGQSARAQDAAVNATASALDAADHPQEELDREAQKDVLGKTLEVVNLLTPDRYLKYEIIDEADLVQVQVVDSRDGNIVRKIPADEIIEMVKQIQKTLSDRLDVKA